jgi:hypothetical protein
MNEWLTILIPSLLSGAIIGALITNVQKTRMERRKDVANAIKTAQRRVEMYHRMRRRRPGSEEDDLAIRDAFHDIQEQTDYYRALLGSYAPWLGQAYEDLTADLRTKMSSFMNVAANETPVGPVGRLGGEPLPDVSHVIQAFIRKSNRLFNLLRAIEWFKFTVSK